MKVTVIGAAGRTGRVLVAQLVAAGHDVTGVVRRESQLPLVAESGAAGVLGDVEGGERGDLAAVLSGADVVVWAADAPAADGAGHSERVRDGGVRVVAAAAELGVGRWIQISSMYANRVDDAPSVMQASMRNKFAMDDAVEHSGMAWTIVRPGGLTDGPAFGTVAIAPALPPAMVTRADVAAVVVELVTAGVGEGTEFDLVNDDRTSVAEAVASL